MKLFELIKKYGVGKGESTMWKSIEYISNELEQMKDTHPEKYWKIVKGMYASMMGEHYNEEFAEWRVEQMYFEDKNGNMHKAPYWSDEKVKSIYEGNKHKLPQEYNCWDFYVTLNMMKADNYCMLKDWFTNASEDEIDVKLVCMTINYLNDDDAPHPESKIWNYLEN